VGFVLQAPKLENTRRARPRSRPDVSSATTVFSQVGFSVCFAMASASFSSSAIPCSSAGWKCSSLILSNGGKLKGSLLSLRSGLLAVTSAGFLVGLSEDDGEGLAARQGVISTKPATRPERMAIRKIPEAEDRLR